MRLETYGQITVSVSVLAALASDLLSFLSCFKILYSEVAVPIGTPRRPSQAQNPKHGGPLHPLPLPFQLSSPPSHKSSPFLARTKDLRGQPTKQQPCDQTRTTLRCSEIRVYPLAGSRRPKTIPTNESRPLDVCSQRSAFAR